jgi:Uma2 family endonuclease
MNAPSSLAVSPERARFRVDDFLLLNASGAFADHARAELIGGEIFVMNAQFRQHAQARRKLARLLEDALAALDNGLGVIDETSVALSGGDMPQPDIVVSSETAGEGPIPGSTVRLVVEISDSTLEHDLGRKLRMYATAGVAEYWVADLQSRKLLRMWQPEGEAYFQTGETAFGARMESATIAGLAVESGIL